MTRSGALVGVAALAACLTLAGCDLPRPGAAMPDPAAMQAIANAPITAARAFGPNLSTVDPCSIVDIRKLAFNFTATMSPADAFDDCPVSVTQPDGTKVDLAVGPLETAADQPTLKLDQIATLPKGMTLAKGSPQTPGFCDEYVTFADGVRLAVDANVSDLTSQSDVCPAAEALARNAADQIRAGSVKHLRYATGSVGRLDPCTLVPDSALAAAGLSGVAPIPYPEHHQCAWLPPDSDTGGSLHVLFEIGTPPKAADAQTDTMSQIAGRESVTTKIDTFCYTQAGLDKYGAADLVELALVDVHSGTVVPDACTVSQAVATAVWPKLPGA